VPHPRQKHGALHLGNPLASIVAVAVAVVVAVAVAVAVAVLCYVVLCCNIFMCMYSKVCIVSIVNISFGFCVVAELERVPSKANGRR